MVLQEALKRRKFLWLATKAVKWLSLNLEVDSESKTWKITSKPIYVPTFQERYYSDITAIFKSDPRNFTVTEERDEAGHFRKFTVST